MTSDACLADIERAGIGGFCHDDEITLICRWMCPESLHAYRRMGTLEHERLINRASTMNVDAIQSKHVVSVSGDEG